MPKLNWTRFLPKRKTKPKTAVPNPSIPEKIARNLKPHKGDLKTIHAPLAGKRVGRIETVFLQTAILLPAKPYTGRILGITKNNKLVLDIGGNIIQLPIGSLVKDRNSHLPTAKDLENADRKAHLRKTMRKTFNGTAPPTRPTARVYPGKKEKN
ncbi:MAG: hypothetical protein HOC95_04005 [Candidatus Diapherotrites archaeon]|nr:hypothetical protein [Candidatus Diapherotrites archaeon]